MSKPKLFLTRQIPDAAIKRLEQTFNVKVRRAEAPISQDELLREVREADALLCQLSDKIDAEVINAAPKLRAIATYAVGTNNIDSKTAAARGIPVCNTPDVLTEATADLTWALMLAVMRRIVEGDKMVRAGDFSGWDPTSFLGVDVFGKTLGIIGMGRIGGAVARRAAGFKMPVLYHNRKPNAEAERTLGAHYATLPELLAQSDIVALNCPLTPETRGMIRAEQLALMKPTAFLVNAARGEVVDEAALVDALKTKRIAGAGLDVFEKEPEVHPGLLTLQNVVLAPHIGTSTVETRTAMGMLAAENLIAVFEGRTPPSRVN